MERSLQLARKGKGYTGSNPMVGAVIVHGDKIIGEGYHRKYGEPHAEVNAIASVKNPSLLMESTLYVTLEPCAHQGKTPPCAALIVSYRIPRVVIAVTDPNPMVAGKGIAMMREGGIEQGEGRAGGRRRVNAVVRPSLREEKPPDGRLFHRPTERRQRFSNIFQAQYPTPPPKRPASPSPRLDQDCFDI